MKHKVYIPGPMTGVKDFNYPAFNRAESDLILRGHDVVNPAKTGEEDTKHLSEPTWHDYMISAIDRMRDVTALYQLRGWWKSYGAWIEFLVAKKMRLKIIKS